MAKKPGNNLNISLGVDIGELKKGFADAIKIVQQSGKTSEESAKQMVDRISKQFDKLGGQTTMKGMIRQMENLGGAMQQMGLDGTKAFRDVVRGAGRLKADQDDLKGAINALRPDAPFNAMATAIKSSAQAMAGVQGAMALFGQESEETQKALLKVQGALALVEGTKALDGVVDAFKELRIFAMANPVTAIAAGVAGAIALMAAFNEESKKTPTIYQQLQDARNAATESIGKEIGKTNALFTIARDENAAKADRIKAIKSLNEISPEYLGNLTLENIRTADATKAVNDYTESLFRQAIAKAAANKAEEKGAELLKAQTAINQAEQLMKTEPIRLGMTPGQAAEYRKSQQTIIQFNKGLIEQVKRDIEAINQSAAQMGANLADALTGGTKTSGTKTPGTTTPAAKQPTKSIEQIGLPIRKLSTDFQLAAISTEQLTTAIATGIPQSVNAAAIAIQGLTNINNAATEQLWMDWESTMNQMQQSIQTFIVNGIGTLAESLGAALVSGDFKGFFDSFLGQFGDFLKQFGQLLISWGVARLALFASFKEGPAGAMQAIAAGAALVAIGGAMRAAISKQTGGSMNYKPINSPGFTPFADGGIVSGPTMGLIGEYPGAVNNPEVIAPLSDLQKMIGGGGGPMVIEHRISGNDLLVLINRAETYKKRNG